MNSPAEPGTPAIPPPGRTADGGGCPKWIRQNLPMHA